MAGTGEEKALTCASCRHAVSMYYGLYCLATRAPAFERCPRFEYEPGTDEAERDAQMFDDDEE